MERSDRLHVIMPRKSDSVVNMVVRVRAATGLNRDEINPTQSTITVTGLSSAVAVNMVAVLSDLLKTRS